MSIVAVGWPPRRRYDWLDCTDVAGALELDEPDPELFDDVALDELAPLLLDELLEPLPLFELAAFAAAASAAA